MKQKKVLQIPAVLTDAFLALAFSAFLLYPGQGGYESIQNGKYECFLFLFGGYLCIMALVAVERVFIGSLRVPRVSNVWRGASAVQKAVFLYWVFTVVSTILSPYRVQAWIGMSRNEGLLTITLYCACFLCVTQFARPRAWMLHLCAGVMTVQAVICFLQMQGYNPLGLYPNGYNYFGANMDYAGIYLGTIGNAGLTAALFCLAVPAFGIWIALGKRKSRIWALLPLFLCLYTLWKMEIDAGTLGVLVGMLLAIPILAPVTRKQRIGIWGVLALLVCAALVYLYYTDYPWGTISELHQMLHGNFSEDFAHGRFYVWKELLRQMNGHWLFGHGPDTMAAAAISNYAREVEGQAVTMIVDVAHNDYLNILYHQGALALAAYLGALGLSAVRWFRRGKRQLAVAVCGGAVLCYSIQIFFSFSMCQSAGVFWLVWALMNTKEEEEEHERTETIAQLQRCARHAADDLRASGRGGGR